ncbi:hypothetical protein [Cohnella silvisoli]|uniref:Uncharacterized protein n=1 Tax=Cohnella silvisoli TaxID=2873699 RepID=A0ABV1KY52_9BACL|nr:hypothetical protein [Cohnella silvisoli]MCD9024111.1 hypothetical protein [Cohnella silvisoli]
MTVTVFLSVALIAMIGFITVPKKLHSLEILFVWMLFIFVQANYVFVVSLNLKRVEYSMQLEKFWSYIIGIFILNPLLIMGMLLMYVACRKWLTRACWIIIFAGLLTCLEYAEERFGVLTHNDWTIPWSYLIWLSMLLLAAAAYSWFHYILDRELKETL